MFTLEVIHEATQASENVFVLVTKTPNHTHIWSINNQHGIVGLLTNQMTIDECIEDELMEIRFQQLQSPVQFGFSFVESRISEYLLSH